MQEEGGKSLSKMVSDIQGIFHKGERVYEVFSHSIFQVQFTEFYETLKDSRNLAEIMIQIAEGVKLLNSQGYIHCDLKPENILVKAQPIQCKIIDFGSSFKLEKGLPKIVAITLYRQLRQSICLLSFLKPLITIAFLLINSIRSMFGL